MEHSLNLFSQCRDRVMLDCRANLKVDEVEEDADEVSFSHTVSYEIKYPSLSIGLLQDDTDGQVASLCRDCPGASRVSTLTSVPSYRTARFVYFLVNLVNWFE